MSLPGRRGDSAWPRATQGMILAALCVAIFGCTSIRLQPSSSEKIPERRWKPGELTESLARRFDRFRTMRTVAAVYYWGPDGRGGFQEAVVVERPDRLRLETLSQLGAILIVTVDNREIVGFHPREGLFYRGRSSRENLLRYTQIPLELEEATALLLGLPPVNPGAPWQRDGNSLVQERGGGGKEVVTFDAQAAVPTKWERLDAAGEVELSAEFSDYSPTPFGAFPLKISLESPTQGKGLDIRYDRPELNAPLATSLFTQRKPANVKEIPLTSIGR